MSHPVCETERGWLNTRHRRKFWPHFCRPRDAGDVQVLEGQSDVEACWKRASRSPRRPRSNQLVLPQDQLETNDLELTGGLLNQHSAAASARCTASTPPPCSVCAMYPTAS